MKESEILKLGEQLPLRIRLYLGSFSPRARDACTFNVEVGHVWNFRTWPWRWKRACLLLNVCYPEDHPCAGRIKRAVRDEVDSFAQEMKINFPVRFAFSCTENLENTGETK